MSMVEAKELVAKFDVDKTGSLSYDQFVAAMRGSAPSEEPARASLGGKTEMRTAFATFDTDASGSIDANELLGILTRGNAALTLEDAKELIASFDVDGDGHFNQEEYLKAMLLSGIMQDDSQPPSSIEERSRSVGSALGLDANLSTEEVMAVAADQLGLSVEGKALSVQVEEAYAMLFDD